MFGFGKSKTEKMVLKLEIIMMSMESAFDKGDHQAVNYYVKHQLEALRWLAREGDWPEEKVEQFLRTRGLVRSITDSEYRDRMADVVSVY